MYALNLVNDIKTNHNSIYQNYSDKHAHGVIFFKCQICMVYILVLYIDKMQEDMDPKDHVFPHSIHMCCNIVVNHYQVNRIYNYIVVEQILGNRIF